MFQNLIIPFKHVDYIIIRIFWQVYVAAALLACVLQAVVLTAQPLDDDIQPLDDDIRTLDDDIHDEELDFRAGEIDTAAKEDALADSLDDEDDALDRDVIKKCDLKKRCKKCKDKCRKGDSFCEFICFIKHLG